MPTETLTLHAMYGVIVQTAKITPAQAGAGVYLSTYQPGRGQYITALDSSQARMLARHPLDISAGVDSELGACRSDPDKTTASIHSDVRP